MWWDDSGWAAQQKAKLVIESWDFKTAWPSRKEEMREVGDCVRSWGLCAINHTHVMKPQFKKLGHQSSLVLPDWWMTHWCSGWCWALILQREGMEALCLWDDPHKPFSTCLLTGLLLSCIFYNKSVIISIALSWVLWIILVNYQAWLGSQEPQMYSHLVWSESSPMEDHVLQLAGSVRTPDG